MAETFKDCAVDLSVNGSAWTVITSAAASVIVAGGARNVGESYVFGEDIAALTLGKRAPLLITVHARYTETAAEAFELARAAYEAGSALYCRWAPKGATAPNYRYTSDVGIVVTPPYPTGEAKTGATIIFQFTLKTPKVTKAAVT